MKTIGIDIGATKTVIASLDNGGEPYAFRKVPSAALLTSKGNAVDSIYAFLMDYLNVEAIDKDTLKGIGIGVPAVLDSNTQEIVSCPNLPGLDRLALGTLLSPKINLPVLVENDVNLIALGEHSFGRGKGIDNLACIFVGSGLGCGLILRGELYTGADGAAAEFGHTIFDPEGKICGCGAQGCIEMYCSGRSLTLAAPEILGETETAGKNLGAEFGRWSLARKVIEAAHAGNSKAIDAMNTSFYHLGLAITNLVNILNPRLIILGGGIVSGWPNGLQVVRETVNTRARTVVRDRLEIDISMLGDKAGLYGAARLVELTTDK
ncbi:MAG: ROK family protein [Pelolinea sp.]|nr:ROK family protein [Pelolinea sp.]